MKVRFIIFPLSKQIDTSTRHAQAEPNNSLGVFVGRTPGNDCAYRERTSASCRICNIKGILKPAEDGKCTVVCFEEENRKHGVSVIDGTLTINPVDKQDFSLHFGVYTRNSEITVFLPESAFSDLRIATDTGDINIPADFTFDSIAINGDTTDVTCRNLTLEGTTGDIRIQVW